MRIFCLIVHAIQAAALIFLPQDATPDSGLTLLARIGGGITPKSVLYAGRGRFFAQNMMYRHTVTVYDRDFRLLGTISDRVPGALIDSSRASATYRGAPVEAAASHEGRYVWVTNYLISGPGFTNPGNDTCESDPRPFDESFLYRIDTEQLRVDRAVRVGSVPKVVAVTPDNRLALVSNWCGGSVSVVDLDAAKEVRRIKVGRYPRGIVVEQGGRRAFVAVMGSYDIAVMDLADFRVSWLRGIGRSPRHLVLDPGGRFLYASLNGDGKVVKVDLTSGKVVSAVATGAAPRSMAVSPDGRYLYVANYESNTLSKIRTDVLRVVQTVPTDHHPIGVAVDPETLLVWVACYSGTIMVFQDSPEEGRSS
jgi:YVTN family beta-propeller protein